MINQSTFINNTAIVPLGSHYHSNDGAAICLQVFYGYPDNISGSSLIIDRCRFVNNTAYQGGAIYINIERPAILTPIGQTNCRIYKSIFIHNKAISRGGAIILCADGNVVVMDTVFVYNMVPHCAVFGTGFNWLRSQFRANFQSSIFGGQL